MKRILVSVLTGLLLIAGCTTAKAQGKLGHFKSAEIMQMMPETETAQKQLQDYEKELQDIIAGMQAEFQTKYMELQNNQSQWSELIKQTKTRELQDMQARVQEFAQQSEDNYQKRAQELFEPIQQKVTDAVHEVAEEGKFAYIFDATGGTLFFGPGAVDVTPLLKKKLGLPDVPTQTLSR